MLFQLSLQHVTSLVSTSYWHVKLDGLKFNGAAVKIVDSDTCQKRAFARFGRSSHLVLLPRCVPRPPTAAILSRRSRHSRWLRRRARDVYIREYLYVDVVLSSGTNMVPKALTASAPSAMKIILVSPPDGEIFTVGAKRFWCAEVLLHQTFPCAAIVLPSFRRQRWVDGKPKKNRGPHTARSEPERTAGPTLRGAARSRTLQEGPSVELHVQVRWSLSSPSTSTIRSTES